MTVDTSILARVSSWGIEAGEEDLMTVSHRTSQSIEKGGWIRRMFEAGIELKKQFGDSNVFDLSLGNPVIEPPKEFIAELANLSSNPKPGMHRYMPNAGFIETRKAIARNLKSETELDFTGEDIVMTCGAAGALNVIFETIINPGDEVIIFKPFFGEFIFYIENHQGKVIVAATDETFQPDLSALETLITPRTRAIVVNSPNNPTGAVYSEDLLAQLGKLISSKEHEYKTEIFLISDEPYRRILFDNLIYSHIFQHHHASISVSSHSKDLSIPGQRIGNIAVNPSYKGKTELLDGLIFWNRSLGFVNAPAIMQNTVENLQQVSVSIEYYQSKRDYLYESLSLMGYDIVKPQGAFYMFPKSPVNDVRFVDELRNLKVLTVPGSGFGTPGYFRISYCVDDTTLRGAIDGFSTIARTYGMK